MTADTRLPPARPDPDAAAFHALFESVAAIGRTERGGLNRLAASAEEGQARDVVCAWLAERGFALQIDPVGNVYARLGLAGAGSDAPCILTGSHLDSQPRGGRYDGAYGVVGACVAADAIRRAHPAGCTHDLAVVIWTNEEGARFAPSMLGSGVYAGQYATDYALASQDGQGLSLREALQAIGYHGSGQGPSSPAACVELHIEQGPELERQGARIGVVEGNWGTMKYIVTFQGVAAHTGPTPMAERRDALLAAGHLIVACRSLSDRTGGRLLSSVGRLDVEPNSTNVVAERVRLYAEMRATDNAMLEQACADFELAVQEAARAAGVQAQPVRVTDRPAGRFDAALCDRIEQAATGLGLSTRRLHTVAGHDAVSLRRRCPAAMVFVPSVKGISHNEAEHTAPEDLEAGVEVLASVLWGLVRQPVA
jgi:N-carbamoyl-L-amino-acid hydrolase